MPFDGIFLRKIVEDIKFLETGKINKINQISEHEILLTIRANYQNHNLLISFHPEFSRIHLTKNTYDLPLVPTSFTMFLRKHIEGSIITSISQHKNDRVITFNLISTNEIGDKTNKKMIIEIMGRVSNFIITNEDKIHLCLKQINPFEGNGRTILPGAIYSYPNDQKKLIDSLSDDEINDILIHKNSFKQISGVSKQLGNYLDNLPSVLEFKNTISKYQPCLMTNENKTDYYFFNLGIPNYSIQYFDSISQMLDCFYYEKDRNLRIKEKSHNLDGIINKYLDKNISKLEKLTNDLENADKNEELKIMGELLMANMYNIPKGSIAHVHNYYTNEMLEIKLDPSISIIDNANRYYAKYQKMRKSKQHISEQIEITKEEINYFSLLKEQISKASLNDCMEITAELEDYGYIKKTNKAKKKNKPNFETYNLSNSTILVGKNNLQNSFLTHKLARSNDLWFHVKDAPGSHVILMGEANEEAIRLAANLAAYYSKYQSSSSVAVDYTYIKNIKKIPGRHSCFVTYTNQHTIYIDPSLDIIKKYKAK